MPHIAIAMYPGRSPEIKEKLALKVQETVAEELGIDKKVISVSVQDVPKEEWAGHMEQFPEEVIFTK